MKNQTENNIIQLEDEIRALKAQLERLEKRDNASSTIIEHSSDGVTLIDNAGIIREWNNGFEKILGLSKEMVVGKIKLWELNELLCSFEGQTSEEREMKRARMEELVANMQQESLIHYVKNHKTGKKRILSARYFPVVMPSGEKMLCNISRDITDEIKSHELIEEYEQKFLAEKKRLEALGNNLPDIILYQYIEDTKTGNRRLSYVSGTWETVTGVPAELALNSIEAAFSVIHPDDLLFVMQKIERSVSTLEGLYVEFRAVIRGHIRWMQMSSRLHLEGEQVVADGIILDITSRKETERRQALFVKTLQIFHLEKDVPKALNMALAEIGEYIDACRAYISKKTTRELLSAILTNGATRTSYPLKTPCRTCRLILRNHGLIYSMPANIFAPPT